MTQAHHQALDTMQQTGLLYADILHACRMEMITPKDYVGALIQLSESRRGEFVDMQFMTEARTTLTYNIPLAEVRARAC